MTEDGGRLLSTQVNNRRRWRFGPAVVYAVLVIGALGTVFPFYEMLVDSFKNSAAIYSTHPTIYPTGLSQLWQNYRTLFQTVPFARNMINSAVASLGTTITVLAVDSLAAFALALYSFRGRRLLFATVLGTMMLPIQVIILPLFIEMRFIGWLNSLQSLGVTWIVNGFGIFFLRGYMKSAVPAVLIEAARVEGAGLWRCFSRIVLPVVRPGLAAVGVIVFMNVWNDFLWPTIALTGKPDFTVPVALSVLNGAEYGQQLYGSVFAGATLATIPIVVIFLIAQRYFVSGLTMGATNE
jgi:cellobiose transport system permease protein